MWYNINEKKKGVELMRYISVSEAAKKWELSERSVRNYCSNGRVDGAVLVGKTWVIPYDAEKPVRKKRSGGVRTLRDILKEEKQAKLHGGIYHKIQIELTYNSNHIEGSRLTHDQTRYIYETNTVGITEGVLRVDDIVEASNHFRCIDLIIDKAESPVTEGLIKQLHLLLKSGTGDSRLDWFKVGEYKLLPNEVGGRETTPPEKVSEEMKKLICWYEALKEKKFRDLLEFHYRFECIHPFQDGNGRVGRLILFKECLRYGFMPFVIDERLKMFYYRGLGEWQREEGFLTETCHSAQDSFGEWLKYFKIEY